METPLKNAITENLPFVIYRFPGKEKVIVIIQNSKELPFRPFTEIDQMQGFLVAPFRGKHVNHLVCLRSDHCFSFSGKKDKLVEFVSSFSDAATDELVSGTGISKEDYTKRAKYLVQMLKDGDLRKVVFSRILEHKLPERFNWASYVFTLMDTYPDAFVYYLNLPGIGRWTGASPETLLSIEGDHAETMALAGTQPIHKYVWTEKEVKEQQIVSDYIEESLFKNKISENKKSGPETVNAGNVVHLKTTFEMPLEQLKNKAGSLITDLHPTPAVCGLPRNKAYNLIRKVEKHDRGLYAGFLGPWNLMDDSKLFVNLRCAELGNKKINLYVGGGFTSESDPEKEWKETMRKSQTLLSVLEKM